MVFLSSHFVRTWREIGEIEEWENIIDREIMSSLLSKSDFVFNLTTTEGTIL